MPATDSQTLERTKYAKPVKWTVIILNDDFTPVDFVIQALKLVFKLTDEAAEDITLTIHENGKANIGEYTREIAEMKAFKLVGLAEKYQHPLKAVPEQLA